MTARHRWYFIVLVLIGLGLSACRSAPQLHNQYSLLQLSEAQQQANGLKLKMRLSNFGEKEMTIEGVEFTLQIAGQQALTQRRLFTLELPGFGTETLAFDGAGLRLPTAAGKTESLHYTLEGRVFRGRFGGGIPFRHEGHLSPVPGIDGAWR